MRLSTPIVLVAAALVLAACACKRNEPSEPPTSIEEHGPIGIDDEAAEATGEEGASSEQPSVGERPAAGARTIEAMPVPDDWVSVSAETPRGATVSLGLPGDWLEARPPNKSTLAVRMAPSGPAVGTKATIVATEFEGGRTALAEHVRTSLDGLASIKSDGAMRVGMIDGYEFVAAWSTPVGDRETVQLLVATGKEAIGITCQMAPGQLDSLSGLCDEIFATLSIKGAKSLK